MRRPLWWLLALGLMCPAGESSPGPPEDLEGSGSGLDSSGSGSGDWFHQAGEMKTDHSDSNDVPVITENSGSQNTVHRSLVLDFDEDGRSPFVLVSNSKSVLERKDVFAAVVAGGVVGLVLAAVLAALLIYTWQRKDTGGYVQGQQRPSDGDHQRGSRRLTPHFNTS